LSETLVTFLDDGAETLVGYLRDAYPGHRAALCTEKALLKPLSPMVEAIRATVPGVEVVVYPGGESRKDRRTKAFLEDRLLALGFGRDSVLLALGGGTVSDLVGFTAGTFLRGVPYLNLPTTLLAMVDAAYGGKTAVNTRQGKNLVGMFHAPGAVFIPLKALETLPDRQYLCGLAECLKHGLVADAAHYAWVVGASRDLLGRQKEAVRALVAESLALKLSVVAEDPQEETGRRNALNAGHTVGHGLELLNLWREPHGFAVARGLLWEAAAAVHDGFLPEAEAGKVLDGLRTFDFPRLMKPARPEALFAAAASDKKNREGHVKYVPLGAVGSLALPPPHTADLTLESLEWASKWIGKKK
jgi:3-dehydroquinate synthase